MFAHICTCLHMFLCATVRFVGVLILLVLALAIRGFQFDTNEEYDTDLIPAFDDQLKESLPEVEQYDDISPPEDFKVLSPLEGGKFRLSTEIEGHRFTRDRDVNKSPMAKYNTDTGLCGIRPYQNAIVLQQDRSHVGNPTHQRIQSRVFGGYAATPGEFPWQAKLEQDVYPQREGIYRNHMCGAVVVNQYWLLTSAHCVNSHVPVKELRVVVGDHNVNEKDPEEQHFFVDRVIKHEEYTTKTKDYDIALIKIKASKDGQFIKFSNLVQPVCLADDHSSFSEGTKCLVSGWGVTDSGRSTPENILNGGEVMLISQQRCQELNSGHKNRKISQRVFCAGHVNGTAADTCKGDSGGPLVCAVSGVYTLYGITSWGKGCGSANKPGVYARVSEFYPWIVSKISLHSSSLSEASLPSRPGVM